MKPAFNQSIFKYKVRGQQAAVGMVRECFLNLLVAYTRFGFADRENYDADPDL